MADDVDDLAAERKRREEGQLEAAYQRGEAFAFVTYDYNAEDVGVIDVSEARVFVVLDADALTGIEMSPADARKLANALVIASRKAHKRSR